MRAAWRARIMKLHKKAGTMKDSLPGVATQIEILTQDIGEFLLNLQILAGRFEELSAEVDLMQRLRRDRILARRAIRRTSATR